MKKALKDAAEFIKEAGFSHIKVELEGTMHRGYGYGTRRWGCGGCNGLGRGICAACTGRGAVVAPPGQRFGEPTYAECDTCHGEPNTACALCSGRGNMGEFTNSGVCQMFILDYVCRKVYGRPIVEYWRENHPDRDWGELRSDGVANPLPFITYALFYPDGSVDSEFTVTIDLDYVEHLPLFLEAFKELHNNAGHGQLEVTGAGMHIAVLPTEAEGRYPCRVNLDSRKLDNFRAEVSKLLPALYFLGTANNRTRGMGYRHPQIATDKYSAICTHGGSSLEYRVFETCYDRPEAIFDFVEVIANTLKFYHDPSLKVKALGKKFGFVRTTNVAQFYSTPEQLRILNATVKYLKPQDKSYKVLKAERGVYYNIKSLTKKEKIKLAQLKADYEAYKSHYEAISKRPLSDYEKQQKDWYLIEDQMNDRDAEELVRRGRQGPLVPFRSFLKSNLHKTPSTTATVTV